MSWRETVFVLLAALLVWQAGAIWRAISSGARGSVLPGGEVSPGQTAGSRVVAVGDLHGDLAQALKVLGLAGLVDAAGNWSGGSATLVQMGDVVDRGPDGLELLVFFDRLQAQARPAGGRVLLLLGNHELMQLQGDFRYVGRGELRKLAVSQSPGLDQAGALQLYRQRLQPGTPAGDALRSRQLLALAGEGHCRSLFVHAGLTAPTFDALSAELAKAGATMSTGLSNVWVDAANKAMKGVLAGCNTEGCPSQGGALADAVFGQHGVLWVRELAMGPSAQACKQVQRVVDEMEVQRMVVGHTVQEGGHIRTRCAGRLVLVDVGLSSEVLGSLAAWQCAHGEATALSAYPTMQATEQGSLMREKAVQYDNSDCEGPQLTAALLLDSPESASLHVTAVYSCSSQRPANTGTNESLL